MALTEVAKIDYCFNVIMTTHCPDMSMMTGTVYSEKIDSHFTMVTQAIVIDFCLQFCHQILSSRTFLALPIFVVVLWIDWRRTHHFIDVSTFMIF